MSVSCRSDWKVFTGNELAALLGWWMLFNWRERNPPPADPSSLYMLATCVSSRILRTMAQQEGFRFEVGCCPAAGPPLLRLPLVARGAVLTLRLLQ